MQCLFIYLDYHSFPIIWVRKPELVREKCAVPNKFGHPEREVLHIGKLIS